MITPTRSVTSLTVLLLVSGVSAQRHDAPLKTKGGAILIEYGPVNVGDHGLHELNVGSSWRLGMGDHSTLTTQVPILAGEEIIAPGGYLAQLFRADDEDLRLSVGGQPSGGRGRGRGDRGGRDRGGRDGGGRDGGGQDNAGRRGGGGGAIKLRGVLMESKKTSKKLHLSFGKPRKSTAAIVDASAKTMTGVHRSNLAIVFGKSTIHVPMTSVLATSHKAKAFRTAAFTYPLRSVEERLGSSKQTVVATLFPRAKQKKGAPAGYNIFVNKDSVTLKPMAKPPENTRGRGRFGRGGGGRGGGRGGGGRGGNDDGKRGGKPQEKPQGPIAGTIEWVPFQGDTSENIAIKSVKVAKKTLHFEIVLGGKIGRVAVALPVLKKR